MFPRITIPSKFFRSLSLTLEIRQMQRRHIENSSSPPLSMQRSKLHSPWRHLQPSMGSTPWTWWGSQLLFQEGLGLRREANLSRKIALGLMNVWTATNALSLIVDLDPLPDSRLAGPVTTKAVIDISHH